MDMKRWPVPHNARMEKAMEPGQVVTIRGKIYELDLKADKHLDPRIIINLSSDGNGENAQNIPFHMSIRFKANEIVFNSFARGEWGKEEKKKLPFKLGEDMDVRIRAHGDKYEIDVNKVHFADYEHRLPLSSVNHVYVDGVLALHGVNWGGKYYSVPFETKIAHGFGTGKRLMISGVPEKKADRIAIDLLTSSGDIAFHFNPRFKQNEIVRNSYLGGVWGNEEKEGKLPLKHDVTFDLVIHNEQYSYQVYLNDERFCTFAHRTDPNSIVGVQVSGDIELQSIMVV